MLEMAKKSMSSRRKRSLFCSR